ncbi:platelet endothelial aggregation receptor 1-like isoform X2 [Haliotis asinina]|uniref:platelet endothelial aggregation receptor 1-like isoform X2 n=1 Tax=Haliotis asinina TaxID=109174 RepID=UPI0035324A89
MVYLFRMSLGRNICCILTVAVHIASILASPNCKNCLFGKCDEEGICTDGCEPGFTDIYCQHPCQETCVGGSCFVDNQTGKTMCKHGCVDGFCYPACKIPCPEGCLRCERSLCENCTLCEGHLYGQSCQHSCFDKCNGYACSIEGNCSMDKCMDGRYGKFCSKSCKPRYESCHQDTGQCIKCRQGLFGDDCQNHCSHECLSMEEDMMYRCRSGCTLCQLPPHTDSKTNMACTSNVVEAKVNVNLGLTIGVIAIAVTSLCLNINSSDKNRCDHTVSGDSVRLVANRKYTIFCITSFQYHACTCITVDTNITYVST